MYFVALGISVTWLIILKFCIIYLLTTGVGVWGNMSPVFWGWPIVNFVFWVGIGHAGTLISAILFLFRQNWRTGINRAAEAMTIFAVVCAGLFPGIHIGRGFNRLAMPCVTMASGVLFSRMGTMLVMLFPVCIATVCIIVLAMCIIVPMATTRLQIIMTCQ